MDEFGQVNHVLSRYSMRGAITGVEPLGGAGGFSGSRFWRIATHADRWCLRRWPKEHPDEPRLKYIHGALQHVAANGFDKIPVPVATQSGATFVVHDRSFWELTRWMPGCADFHEHPNSPRLIAALWSLASFHVSAAGFPPGSQHDAPSPGIVFRRQQIEHLLGGELDEIQRSIRAGDWPELESRARRVVALFRNVAHRVLQSLRHAETLVVSCQSCIRDIWHDHVLFTGDDVTGLVDFGAMNIESVAGDVARLLGSLVEDDSARWSAGLDAYRQVRPLSPTELELVRAFDQANVVLSGISWLRWIYVDVRQFEDRHQIIGRLDHTLRRMTCLCDSMT